ncbi:META domain-containing protein [Pseudooctadecabacter jejudonensis]|uniref:META domain protein n=1 Tax=Pseudooctadecabacter jejudonensis TaxID=1391910 RepID=A0A1Y5S3Z4_9RHOB|nr:META domain-containing protein [Pseudooctadecabacter jejudonensis]SLN29245.1 META domain protein [Pseudooctadecabacter jejudonensis]
MLKIATAASFSLLSLTACLADETVSGYADPSATYHLIELDDAPFSATATIAFPQEGRVAGNGPCNGYSSIQTVPYPWFNLEFIRATRRACPELAEEAAFFAALQDMTLAEASGGVLILSNEEGRSMVFEAR